MAHTSLYTSSSTMYKYITQGPASSLLPRLPPLWAIPLNLHIMEYNYYNQCEFKDHTIIARKRGGEALAWE